MFYDLWKLAVAYVAVLTFVFSLLGEPGFSGWAIFSLTLIGLASVIFAAAWFHQTKSIDGWIQSQGEAPIVYTLSDEEVETTANPDIS